ncbi:hypothetical protein EVAR_13900_1 [Eumeta japonica]|uniref:Uncharacterized protein n=1 Tax=Eumeta variegata TaxID=151549 RepID=A0A4C1U945_EUMVA|nr:hypothetical protein EVAR_13900_1 [Eumeta japonica]
MRCVAGGHFAERASVAARGGVRGELGEARHPVIKLAAARKWAGPSARHRSLIGNGREVITSAVVFRLMNEGSGTPFIDHSSPSFQTFPSIVPFASLFLSPLSISPHSLPPVHSPFHISIRYSIPIQESDPCKTPLRSARNFIGVDAVLALLAVSVLEEFDDAFDDVSHVHLLQIKKDIQYNARNLAALNWLRMIYYACITHPDPCFFSVAFLFYAIANLS